MFSVTSKPSMMKPCGLLSLLTASSRRQRVTRLRSVTELSLRMICRANVRTLYGYLSKSHRRLSISIIWLMFPEIIRL